MLKIADGVTISNKLSIAGNAKFVTTGTATISLASGSVLSGITLDSGSASGTTAKILGGTASSDSTLTAAWSESLSKPSAGAAYAAVLELTGTGSGTFVLQMSYDEGTIKAAGLDELVLALGWLDSSGKLVNAVSGNSGGTATRFTGAYNAGNSAMNQLGAYGVDTENNTVWAVINHNSEFTVTAVPEPGTIAMLVGAATAGAWVVVRRRRKRPAQVANDNAEKPVPVAPSSATLPSSQGTESESVPSTSRENPLLWSRQRNRERSSVIGLWRQG